MSSPNRHGLPDWSIWDPVGCSIPGQSTDTYRMRVPGGWLIRVYDMEPKTKQWSSTGHALHADTTRTHVLFIPDPAGETP